MLAARRSQAHTGNTLGPTLKGIELLRGAALVVGLIINATIGIRSVVGSAINFVAVFGKTLKAANVREAFANSALRCSRNRYPLVDTHPSWRHQNLCSFGFLVTGHTSYGFNHSRSGRVMRRASTSAMSDGRQLELLFNDN
jgi:hypothetical protein